MPKLAAFDNPLLLGFDHFERLLNRVSKASADGYPPYNIARFDDFHLRITLAVAGFSEPELSVTVEDNQLLVRGQNSDPAEEGRVFLHRGIAARPFQRSFVLAEGIEVRSARMDNGLLHIDLERHEPEIHVKTIPIGIEKTDKSGKRKQAK